MRVGIGYDIHPFAVGRPLVLGGVVIPSDRGLAGHSDADVLLHAMMDAVLGAAGLPDIGHHFPNTDPQYRNVSSLQLVRHVAALLRTAGWSIGNIDATLIVEAPKIGPHVAEMKRRVAEAFGIAVTQVGIKATTNEGLGTLGRGEGMAAMAVACLKPLSK